MDRLIQTLVDGVLTPLITLLVAPIPFLVSSGALLVVFAALWVAFAYALAREPARVERAWARLRTLPLVAQAAAWLLFLPVLAGLWIWQRSWPLVGRLALVLGIAGWNLLVFVPRPA